MSRPQGAHEIVACPVQQVVGEGHAGGYRLDHFAPYDAARELRILDLLADGDAEAQLNQPPHILIHRFRRNTGERHVGSAAVVPGGERETEDACRGLRVVVEHLVELAHAKEQDRVLMPRLDLAILLHERGLHLRGAAHLRSGASGRSLSVVVTKTSIPFA